MEIREALASFYAPGEIVKVPVAGIPAPVPILVLGLDDVTKSTGGMTKGDVAVASLVDERGSRLYSSVEHMHKSIAPAVAKALVEAANRINSENVEELAKK